MDHAYIIVDQDGSTRAMENVLCKNEDKELQVLLSKNFDLLPGNQIDPDDPCRWMLIKREMPVPDPYTGADRWSIDFFLVDQNATPTFVECKRFLDTRSRREVVGQVLEYAANGQHFWSSESIRAHAGKSATSNGTTIDESIQKLQPSIAEPDEFFSEVERRLKAGELRLIFFFEQAPHELKRLVEFLNKQMNLTEVLLVEARHYRKDEVRIVVPRLFGFTEQALAIKRAAAAEGARAPVAKDWSTFADNAITKGIGEEKICALKLVYETCKTLGAEIAWGRGVRTASFSPRWPSICANPAPFSVYSNGNLELHLSSYQASAHAKTFAAAFAEVLPVDYSSKWLTVSETEWLPNVKSFIEALKAGVTEKSAAATATA